MRGYEATYGSTYVAVGKDLLSSEVKKAALRPSDQLSIEEIDLAKLEERIVAAAPAAGKLIAQHHVSRTLNPREGEGEDVSGADGEYVPSTGDTRDKVLRAIKARRGQRRFRDSLIRRYGGCCMVSDCALLDVLEAAHIWPYRGAGDNHPGNGLLLRADLHTLFDLNLMGIVPDSMEIQFRDHEAMKAYGALSGRKLRVKKKRPDFEALELRWNMFNGKNRESELDRSKRE